MKWFHAYLLAIGLHLAVLFGVWPSAAARPPKPPPRYIEVSLVALPPAPVVKDALPNVAANPAKDPGAPGPKSDDPADAQAAMAPVPLPETPSTPADRQAARRIGPPTPGAMDGADGGGAGGGGGGGARRMANYRGHTYEVVAAPDGITWTQAKAAAEARGGHLAILWSTQKELSQRPRDDKYPNPGNFYYDLVFHPEYWKKIDDRPMKGIPHYWLGPWIGGEEYANPDRHMCFYNSILSLVYPKLQGFSFFINPDFWDHTFVAYSYLVEWDRDILTNPAPASVVVVSRN